MNILLRLFLVLGLLLSFNGYSYAKDHKNGGYNQALNYYFKLLPVNVSRDIILKGVPEQVRAEAERVLTIKFIEKIVGQTLSRHFTPHEIIMMANFYGGKDGKEILRKYPGFLEDMGRQFQKEMNALGVGGSNK